MKPARAQGVLPRPRPVLRVGVVGHTRGDFGPATGALVSDVLRTICASAEAGAPPPSDTGAVDTGARSAVRLVTGLAPGFDSLVWGCWRNLDQSRSAVGRAAQMRSALVVLPNSLGAYRERLQLPPRGGSPLDQLEQALDPDDLGFGTVSLFELADDCPALEGDHGDLHAARLVVRNCDILLAYWDGDSHRATGSGSQLSVTFLAVQLAVQRGLPVLWIRHTWPGGIGAGVTGARSGGADLELVRRNLVDLAAASDWKQFLAERLRPLLWPAGPPAGAAESGEPHTTHHSLGDLVTAPLRVLRSVLRRLIRGRPTMRQIGPIPPRPRGLDAEQIAQMERLLEEPDPKELRWSVRALGAIWKTFWDRVGPKKTDDEPDAASEPKPLIRWQVHDLLDRCNALAVAYMGAYRGAFAVIYLLGACAVLLATVAFVLLVWEAKVWTLVLGAAEIAVIAAILRLRFGSMRAGLLERALQYRRLAELLRLSDWTMRLGSPLDPIAVPAHRGIAHARHSWVAWIHDAWLREVELPGSQDGTRRHSLPVQGFRALNGMRTLVQQIREQCIQGQIHYHRRTALRYQALSKAVEDLVSSLFLVVLLAVSASLVVGLCAYVHHAEFWRDLPLWTKLIALSAGTALPALAGALHGIKTQLESDRLQQNSESMELQLRDLDAQLAQLENERGLPALEQLDTLLQRASAIMLAEVDDWHTSHLTHGMPLP